MDSPNIGVRSEIVTKQQHYEARGTFIGTLLWRFSPDGQEVAVRLTPNDQLENRLLRWRGYEVVEATNGEQAVELATRSLGIYSLRRFDPALPLHLGSVLI